MSTRSPLPDDVGYEHALRVAVEQATDDYYDPPVSPEDRVARVIEAHCDDIEQHPHLAAYSLGALRRLAAELRAGKFGGRGLGSGYTARVQDPAPLPSPATTELWMGEFIVDVDVGAAPLPSPEDAA